MMKKSLLVLPVCLLFVDTKSDVSQQEYISVEINETAIFAEEEISETITEELITFNVTATCYNPDPRQCDETYWLTANMSKIDTLNPIKHRWVALSRDLFEYFDFNDTLIVSGTGVYDGEWIVMDRMNRRWTYRIDFLIGKEDFHDRWDDIVITPKHSDDVYAVTM